MAFETLQILDRLTERQEGSSKASVEPEMLPLQGLRLRMAGGPQLGDASVHVGSHNSV